MILSLGKGESETNAYVSRPWEAMLAFGDDEVDTSSDPPDEHKRTTDLDTQPQTTSGREPL